MGQIKCQGFNGAINSACVDNNGLGAPNIIFVTTAGFAFDDDAAFQNRTNWINGILSGDIIPMPRVHEFDDNSEEDQVFSSAHGIETLVRHGRNSYMYRTLTTVQNHNKLRERFDNKRVRIFKADVRNNILGVRQPDGTKIAGVLCDKFIINNRMQPTGSDPGWTPISINEGDPDQLNTKAVQMQPTWLASLLLGLVEVTLQIVGTPSASIIDFSVNEINGLLGTNPVTGLVAGDITLLTAAGASQTITSLTETSDGNYRIAGSSLVSGTLNLQAPSSLVSTFDPPIQSAGAIAVTI